MDSTIPIEYGFLQLTRVPKGETISVKGSAITSVTTADDGREQVTHITLGGEQGWYLTVAEKRERILHAIDASYKQSYRR